jgi:hypothetical protein
LVEEPWNSGDGAIDEDHANYVGRGKYVIEYIPASD